MVAAPKNKKPCTLLAGGQSLFDAQGRKISVVVGMHDITERKKAEEELKEFAAKLERSNNELQDFASVASHDLQEPLRKVQAFADRLKAKYGEQLNEEGRDYLERMQMRQLLQNLIGNALKFHRPGAAPVVKIGGRICIGAAGAGGEANRGAKYCLTVEDNGIEREQAELCQPSSKRRATSPPPNSTSKK